jgi:hypothetical protein
MKYSPYSFRHAEEILSSKNSTFKEIKDIISHLQLDPWDENGHRKIKDALKNKGWLTEERIFKQSKVKWRYDAYKDRVAIEIDLSGPCYRSFLKFGLGCNQDKIDVGVIIVYDEFKIIPRNPKKSKIFTYTRNVLEGDLSTIIHAPIFLMGIYP